MEQFEVFGVKRRPGVSQFEFGSRVSYFIHFNPPSTCYGVSTDADLFRSRAAECRQQAERSVHVADKEAWLRIAEDWLKLVQSAEYPAGDVAAALNRLYVVK